MKTRIFVVILLALFSCTATAQIGVALGAAVEQMNKERESDNARERLKLRQAEYELERRKHETMLKMQALEEERRVSQYRTSQIVLMMNNLSDLYEVEVLQNAFVQVGSDLGDPFAPPYYPLETLQKAVLEKSREIITRVHKSDIEEFLSSHREYDKPELRNRLFAQAEKIRRDVAAGENRDAQRIFFRRDGMKQLIALADSHIKKEISEISNKPVSKTKRKMR